MYLHSMVVLPLPQGGGWGDGITADLLPGCIPSPWPSPGGRGNAYFNCRGSYQYSPLYDVHAWLGRQDDSSLRVSPCGPLSLRDNVLSRYTLESNLEVLILPYSPLYDVHAWLGRQDDSSLRVSPCGPLSLRDNVLSRYTLESNLEVLILPYSPLYDVHAWLGRQDYSSLRVSPCGPLSLRDNVLSRYTLESNLEVLILPYSPLYDVHAWLGRQDSNLRIRGSKPRALPLGDVPSNL